MKRFILSAGAAVALGTLFLTGVAQGAGTTAQGNAAHGKQLFAANCAACHGATGGGGVGPNLQHEISRKNFSAVVAQIKNPAPPMPKLYPTPLNAKDVNDLAAFVLTL